MEGKSGPITPKKPRKKKTTTTPGAGVQKKKPGRRRRLSQEVDDDAEHRDASTQTSSLALTRTGRSLRRNASTQTSSSIGAGTGTQTSRSEGTALATLRTRRRAGWVLQALGTFWSGVLLNAAFFHINPRNSAADFCLRWQQLHQGAPTPDGTQRARPTLAATGSCLFALHFYSF